MADEIWIPCEGSGRDPARGVSTGADGFGTCAMCGLVYVVVDYRMLSHVRDDILARIERGDFG